MRKLSIFMSVLSTLLATHVLSAATLTITNGNNSGAGSLRDAVNLAVDNDVLVFAPGVDTVHLLGAVIINKSINITTALGDMVYLTPASIAVRLMQITSGKQVILENLHFYNSNQLGATNSLSGLGISNAGNLTLYNCNFEALWSSANGAAIFSTVYSSIKMYNCLFINNRSDYGNGAAMVNAGTVHATNCLFVENHTDWGEGGALQGLYNGVFRLYQCQFIRNYGMSGGAVMTQNTSTLYSRGCSYIGNHSGSDGGAIFNGSTTYSYGDSFEEDTAEYDGGAIANYSVLHLQNQGDSNFVFQQNRCTGRGGAIVNYGNMNVTGVNTTNTAPAYFGNPLGMALGNIAVDGGAIGNYPGASCSLSGNIIIQNNCVDTLSGKGGAIFSDSLAILQLNNGVTIYRNKAYAGGGIFNHYGTVVLNQVKLNNNFAKLTGGAIHSESTLGTSGGNLTFNNVELAFNKVAPTGVTGLSGRFGGAIYLNGGTGNMQNLTFEGNLIQFGLGGGLYAQKGNFNFSNCTFFGNYTLGTNTTGGAIKTSNVIQVANGVNTPIINLNSCTIAANQAVLEGGGIHTANYNVSLNNTIITGNSNYDLVGYFSSSLGHNIFNTKKVGTAFIGNINGNLANKTYAQVFGGMTLTYNGAWVKNLALPLGSAAVNMGATSLTLDQRGLLRDNLPDVGAVELFVELHKTPNTSSIATFTVLGPDGWNHYYNGDGELLLSLNFNGQTPPTITGANPTMTVSIGLTPNAGSGWGTDLTSASYVALPNNGWFSMNRYWKVDVLNQPTDSVRVRFYYTLNDYTDLANIANSFMPNTVVNENSMRFYKVSGANNPLSLNVPTSAFRLYENGLAPSRNTWKKGDVVGKSYADFWVSSFSGGSGGASSNGGPMPVKWVKFEAHTAEDRTVNLNWVTNVEYNNEKFVVERSTDGQTFEPITEIPAVGFADGETFYKYTDEHLSYRRYYYRIKQIDIDGKYSYSDTKFVLTDGAVLAYPNPTQGHLYISKGIERQSLDISTPSGTIVKYYHKAPDELDISDLLPGVYYIRIGTEYQAIVKE